MVELRYSNTRWEFDVSDPNICHIVSGVEWKNLTGPEEEPLLIECKAFLEYKGVDHMGPKVVKLIEEIVDACKPGGP